MGDSRVRLEQIRTTGRVFGRVLVVGAGETVGAVDMSTASAVLYEFPAGSWDYPAINPAPLDTDSGVNGTIKRQLLDDAFQNSVISQVKLPGSLNLVDSIYFEAVGYAVTAVAGREIRLTFGHAPMSDGESWDTALSPVESTDASCNSVQDALDFFQWSETVSNLGWTSNELVRISLKRASPTGTNLVGNWGLVHFRIRVPRA